MISKEEFKEGYLASSGIDKEFFDKNLIIIPCNNGQYQNIGWVVIPNDPFKIKINNKLFNEDVADLLPELK